eukprot:UN03097
MSSFNGPKPAQSEPQSITKSELLNSRGLPINYGDSHRLPTSMFALFEKPILSELEHDPSFIYLPILSRFQIQTQPYCQTCYGLLGDYHKGGNQLHLQTPHNYPCPNKDCAREFVLQSHLAIHLKVCAESIKLKADIKGMSDIEYEECINLKIQSPINNYFQTVRDNDVNPSNEWLNQQIQWRQQKRKKHKRK